MVLAFKSTGSVQTGLFGICPINPKALTFLGDYLIIATTDKILRQPIPNMAPFPSMKGAHAGLTFVEMRVPLILISK